MKRSRLAVVGALSASMVGLAAVGDAVAADATSVVHFSGQAGSAILTDCEGALAPGDRCRAVSVTAFEQRADTDDPAEEGPGVMVALFDVTIIDTPPFFAAEVIGSGFTEDATVQIPQGMPHGTAVAREVALETCEFPDGDGQPVCEAAGSVSVEVQWDGFGPTTTSRFHEMFTDPFAFSKDRFTSTFRSADASGFLDGVAVEDTALFPSSLSSSRFGTVSRFAPLATSKATAVAAATAASVGHTTESSAGAALTNCPPAPPVGAVCDGVLVSAFALDGRVGHQPVDTSMVSASFFELTFTPDGFVPRSVGSGFDEAATFHVDPDLTGATADAEINLEACDELGCTPVRTVALSVAWTGQGDIQSFRFHSQFWFDDHQGNTVGQGKRREAVAVGTLDAAPFTGLPIFVGSIQQVTINSTAT